MYFSPFLKKMWLFLVLCLSFWFFSITIAHGAGENLISNPDLEVSDASGQPVDWIKGRWGTNTTVFEYPVSGFNDSKAAKLTITSYSSGDAKWKPAEVSITAGREYQFTNYYISNVTSYVTLQFKKTDGTYSYKDLARPEPASEFTRVRFNFIAPANTVSVTVFHLINQVGSLTVDAYDLKDVTPPPPPPPDENNLIANPSFEFVSNGLPTKWFKGKWGNNNAQFIFPVAAQEGGNAARIEITSLSTGDAKWYFDEVPTTGGSSYEFTNYYRSNVKTYIVGRFLLNDGTYSFIDLGTTDPSSSWRQLKKFFNTPSGTVSLTLFHLIKNVGYLETDNFTLKKLVSDPTKFSTGMVSLNFDDGWRSVYENAIPILNAAGFKSTQYIISGRLSSQYPGYVRASEVLSMQSQGHEIGAHTRTHPDLTTLSLTQLRSEITGSRNDLLAIGAKPVDFFAYPLGAYNDQVISVVKEAGFAAGRSSDGGDNAKTQYIWALRRQPMLANTTFTQVKGYIDKAVNDKTWLILLFHEVNYSGNYYSVTPELFQQIIDYLKQKNITPVTMRQGIDMMNQ